MSGTSPAPARQPVVWVINEGGHDFSSAEQYGRLVPITSGTINPFNVDRLMVLAAPRLEHATDEDYLLISGPQMLCAVVIAMWLKRFGKANLLQWSTKYAKYSQILLTDRAVEANALKGMRIAQ